MRGNAELLYDTGLTKEQAERLFTAGKTSFHKSFKNNAQYFMADKGELVPGNSARTGGAEVLVKLPLNITASPSGCEI